MRLILFGSSHSEWICNDRMGFWIGDWGKQAFMTAERSGNDNNAECVAGYNATH
jgi:hypothetical protein